MEQQVKDHQPRICILAIGATEDVCTYYQQIFRAEGCHLTTLIVREIEATLSTIVASRPDLILCDAEAAHETFLWQCVEQLKTERETSELPLLVCVPAPLSLVGERITKQYHVATLFKPLQAHDLVDNVRSLLVSSSPFPSSAPSFLEETSNFYQAIIASSDDAIVSKTLQGIIMSWNQAAERLFGYSAHEAIGKPITLIIPTELHEEEVLILSKLSRGEHIDHYETVRMRKDGTRIEVSLSISPVKDRTGTIIGAAKIARDITERKELERRKDEFISIASHELKTPLTTLQGMTQILLRRLEPHDQYHIVPLLHTMQTQVHRLGRLITELLDASKIQSGHIEYEAYPVNLASLLQESIELLQLIYPTHLLRFQHISPVWVMGDKDHLSQMVTNLVGNAVKYSPQASEVDITLSCSETTALLSVRDYGIGIPSAYLPHVFDRFFRVPGTHSKASSGLGLGLYITAGIIKRHAGTITVTSEEQQGTTFHVSLPRSQPEKTEDESGRPVE